MAKGKRRRNNAVNVHIHLPREAYGAAGRATAGFLFTNPVTAIIIAAVGIIAIAVIGGLALPIFFGIILNPWMWVLSLLIGLAFKPRTGAVIGFAALVGLLFWGYGVYLEFAAMQQICNIPIIGWLACGAWNVITFIPKMFVLGLNIMVAFLELWIISFIKYEATGGS